jgi:hypothetical protein
MPRPNSSGC